jgi:hypothetical protein
MEIGQVRVCIAEENKDAQDAFKEFIDEILSADLVSPRPRRDKM